MKTSQEKLKAEFLAEAEALFDRLMEWDEQTSEPDMTQIEEIVLELRQRLGEQMAQAVMARQEKRQPAEKMRCPQCNGEVEPKGQKGNRVESRVGSLQLDRNYYYCPRCRQGFFPLDEQLRLWEKHWSEQVAKQAVWLSGLVPFAQVERISCEVGGVDISQSSVWRRVDRWGRKLQAMEALQQAKAYGFEEPENLDPNRSLGRMGAAMDGTMVHIRGEGWKELKVGCVFDIAPRRQFDPYTHEEIELGSAIHNSYVAHLGGPAVFGRQLWAEARQRFWMHAEDSLTLGDGATWIWNLVDEHFYASHQLVDWYHATEHLANAAKALYGEGTSAAQRWYRRWETKLYQGHVDQLVQALKHQALKQPHKAEALHKETGYFHNNRKRMNYLDLRSEGYPIGSGMVESAAKQYKARFCGPGMRWSRKGAERLLPVRTAILSSRFDKMWRLAYNSPPN